MGDFPKLAPLPTTSTFPKPASFPAPASAPESASAPASASGADASGASDASDATAERNGAAVSVDRGGPAVMPEEPEAEPAITREPWWWWSDGTDGTSTVRESDGDQTADAAMDAAGASVGAVRRTLVVVSLPIRCVSHRDGVYECALDASDAKPSETAFEAVAGSFNGRTTLVRCFPRTGRTHQIRLHLEALGHPIANDPCYGGQMFYGEFGDDAADTGRGGDAKEDASDAKPSETAFEAVAGSFNGRTTLVRCFPRTGRTHQIRLHLEALGHPIANDPCYGGQMFYGEFGDDAADTGRGGDAKDDAKEDAKDDAKDDCKPTEIGKECTTSKAPSKDHAAADQADRNATRRRQADVATARLRARRSGAGAAPNTEADAAGGDAKGRSTVASPSTHGVSDSFALEGLDMVQRPGEDNDAFMKRTCCWCRAQAATAAAATALHAGGGCPDAQGTDMTDIPDDAAFNEMQMHCAGIWLHASRYSLNGDNGVDGGWSYAAPDPVWALPGFDQ